MTKKKSEKKVEDIVESKTNFDFVKQLDAIYIIGRGGSAINCPEKKPDNAEYWVANDLFKLREPDRIFIMHDLYITQFNYDRELIKKLNEMEKPVYTLGAYSELKNNVLYPISDVISEFDLAYFLNTASYMLALAITQRPKKIMLFGIDMSMGSGQEYMRNEKACLEQWIGVAVGRGINIQITPQTQMLKRKDRENFYGMKEIKPDKPEDPIRLAPIFVSGCGEKCAAKYQLVRKGIVM